MLRAVLAVVVLSQAVAGLSLSLNANCTCPTNTYLVPPCNRTATCKRCDSMMEDAMKLVTNTPCEGFLLDSITDEQRVAACNHTCKHDLLVLIDNSQACPNGMSRQQAELMFCPPQTAKQQAQLLLRFRDKLANGNCDSAMQSWAGDSPCSWPAVSCHAYGSLAGLVSEVNLGFRDTPLVGSIPTEIGEIFSLVVLDLAGNDFCGPIPKNFEKLAMLSLLSVHDNPKLCNSDPSKLPISNFDNTELEQQCIVECVTKESWNPDQTLAEQKDLLLLFRNGLINAHYALDTTHNWVGVDVCAWPGVECWTEGKHTGLVKSVDLSFQTPKLIGGIAPELFMIQTLATVHLQGNNLCGPLPDIEHIHQCKPAKESLSLLEIYGNSKLCSAVPVDSALVQRFDDLNLYQPCPADCNPDISAFPCDSGKFFDWESLKCKACEGCTQDFFYRDGCSNGFEGTCVSCKACNEGFYRSGCVGTNSGECIECASCAEGQFRSGCGGASKGFCKSCATCGAGEYLAGCMLGQPGACLKCESCGEGYYRQHCSGASAGQCVLCQRCEHGQFLEGCTGTQPGVCKACEACPEGEFRTGCEGGNPGKCQKCATCATGRYRAGCSGTNEGSCEACAMCPSGSYRKGCADLSAGECETCGECEAGSYRSMCQGTHEGVCTLCDTCPVGQFRPSCPGECQNCEGCGEGFWRSDCTQNSEGHCEPCAACAAGQYRSDCNGSNQGECVACAGCGAGKRRIGCTGANPGFCALCPSGKFSSDGDTECHSCEPGSVATKPGSSSCTICPKGSHAASPTMSCVACAPGKITALEGMVQCTDCERGHIQPEPSKSFCNACPAGLQWRNTTHCMECPPGSYSSESTECLRCLPGYYSNAKQSSCQPCPAGTRSVVGGAPDECEHCPAGMWSQDGSSACFVVNCPPNSKRDEQGLCVCEDGFSGSVFWNKLKGEYAGECVRCQKGFWASEGQCNEVSCPSTSSGHPDCKCNIGFSGSIFWSSAGHFIGGCTELGCPANSKRVEDPSGSQPFLCECLSGFEGQLTPSLDGFDGSCTKCRAGFWSDRGATCTAVECPPNSSGTPCTCDTDFEGSLLWGETDGRYHGECTACAVGFKLGTLGCEIVECPPFSSGFPDCNCISGYAGTIEWRDGAFEGECTKCPPGLTTTENESICSVRVPCPPASTFSKATGTCECNAGFSGQVFWQPDTSMFIGGCTPCPEGFWRAADSKSSSCAAVLCPVGAVEHPACKCDVGFQGGISWSTADATYHGVCQPCSEGTFSNITGSHECSKCDRGEWSPAKSSRCLKAACPANSDSWPHCRCKPGFSGRLTWDPELGAYSGDCSKCPAGSWSAGGNETCVQAQCPENSQGFPNCRCIKGYTGLVVWNTVTGKYRGSCAVMPCPPKSSGWPACVCDPGTSGLILWRSQEQQFAGTCTPCADGKYQDLSGQTTCKRCGTGFAATSGTTCERISCPANADGHPNCQCVEGFFGVVKFNQDINRYTPLNGCSACTKGYWSIKGQAACESVECPLHSTGHPDCTCEAGLVGDLTWDAKSGIYEGHCTDPKCPPNALGWPDCECVAGFKGVLVYMSAVQSWSGDCVPCTKGFTSHRGDEQCHEVACPANSNNHPYCGCDEGYTGTLSFSNGKWLGECVKCAPGFWSEGHGGPCVPVECPANSKNHPSCICRPGFQSEEALRWNATSGAYIGECTHCPKGMWSEAGGPCKRVQCPGNADNFPNCTCNAGFSGAIEWDSTHGFYSGECTECPDGFTSTKGSKSCNIVVDCPTNSEGHPRCACKSMHSGDIQWTASRTYTGTCTPCERGKYAGLDSAKCYARDCPAHASSWPDCECDAGYFGHIVWRPVSGTFGGVCTPCTPGTYQDAPGSKGCNRAPSGFWSNAAASGYFAVECPENAEGHPNCACKEGFSGALVWYRGKWTGQCVKCSRGYWNKGGDEGCSKVACPRGSAGHPHCKCASGTFGSLQWRDSTGEWEGACTSCPAGKWSTPGATACTASACPAASSRNTDDDNDLCSCNGGFAGKLEWQSELGLYYGSCDACTAGSRPSADGCVPVPCPENAVDHPNCGCRKGYVGRIAFSTESWRFEGECAVCSQGTTTSSSGRFSCDVVVSCPSHSTRGSDGSCSCNKDYRGTIVWHPESGSYLGACTQIGCPLGASGSPDCQCNEGFEEVEPLLWDESTHAWSGECKQCAVGQWSNVGSTECTDVSCPDHSAGHPNCRCEVGFAGTIVWSSRSFVGQCQRCMAGSAPSADSLRCEAVACPAHSERIVSASGSVACRCNDGFEGDIEWGVIAFVGSCKACPKGYWSTNGGGCRPVQCPENSNSHPHCQCAPGYFGEVVWSSSSGSYVGTCEPCEPGYTSTGVSPDCALVACPAHSTGHPACVCEAPMYGSGEPIRWDPSTRTFIGECAQCPDGQYSPDGVQCVPVKCPENSAGGALSCTCLPGFFGAIEWSSDGFHGTCEQCSVGTTSRDGLRCVDIPCPAHATNHPQCQCGPGTTGSIAWDDTTRNYVGSCTACPAGQWTNSKGVCVPVPCPANAHEANNGLCVCDAQHYGQLVWNAASGTFDGQCQPCGRGFRASSNSTSCTMVGCPVNSFGHPECPCADTHTGALGWDPVSGTYIGACWLKPSPGASASASPPPPPPIVLPTPSPSFVRPSLSASVTPSVSFEVAPSPTPCLETKVVIEGTCDVCGREYVRCGSTTHQHPVYCWGGHSRQNGRITYRGGRWIVVENGETYLHAPDSLTVPTTDWRYQNQAITQPVPKVSTQCSDVFFEAIHIQHATMALMELELVEQALSEVLHVPRSNLVIDRHTKDHRVYFSIDNRLQPTTSEFVLESLANSLADGSLFDVLVFNKKIQCSNVTRADIVLDEEDELEPSLSASPAPSLPSPSPSPSAKRALPHQPRGRRERDAEGCIPGSVWCESRGGCIPATEPCLATKPVSEADCEVASPEAVNAKLSHGDNVAVHVMQPRH